MKVKTTLEAQLRRALAEDFTVGIDQETVITDI